jgi:hypothetical protein
VHEHDAGCGSSGGAVLNCYRCGRTDDRQAQLSSQKPRTHTFVVHLFIVTVISN